jgi:hypothetical protein
MAGLPAFQANAFQNAPAFQAGVNVVASDYSLGALSIAKPALQQNYVFSAPAYSLGSPVFATPILQSFDTFIPLTVNPYSLGSPVFGNSFLRSFQHIVGLGFSVGSPEAASPAITQNHLFSCNAFWLTGALDFGAPDLGENYQFTGLSWSVGALEWSPVGPVENNYQFGADAYSLGSPSFGYPRLQWSVVETGVPRSVLSQVQEASAVLIGLLDYLQKSIPPGVNDAANTARGLIYALRSNAEAAIRGNTLGTQLAEVVAACDRAGATLIPIEEARRFLMSQVASRSVYTQIVFRNGLLMVLALESSILIRTVYKTRDRVQNAIIHVRESFDAAKAIGIDEVDATVYQTLTMLGGAVINHLAQSELQLPRMVGYQLPITMPSLYIANRIYADASRADEIELENGVIHPAFCPRTLRVLSNAGR